MDGPTLASGLTPTHHHHLGRPLQPDDFGLKDGATINVIVPEEYLHSQQATVEEDEGTAAAAEAEPVVAVEAS